jgi:hypothetical protein
MRPLKYFVLLCCLLAPTCIVWSKQNDPALQQALDELTRLGSYTETGLNYAEYSDRLLTATGNIEVALKHATDDAAKRKIEEAVDYYVLARTTWEKKIDGSVLTTDYDVQQCWEKGRAAAQHAAEYAFGDEATRKQFDDRERAEVRAREEGEKQTEQAEKEAENLRQGEASKPMSEAEKKRRFAPEGTVFNLKPITVTVRHKSITISPGTELKVVKKNPDGTLHVQKNEVEADVLSDDVTTDRDWLAAYRILN